ncbi:MAG: insulinase family protein [Lachnospiraceae bacterium]|nr:insulinase family protein [Lachnospiraceae bacterium]
MSRVIKNTETLKKLSAYEIVSEENLPDISGYGIVLRHKKSGAKVAVISCEDNNKVFSVGFRTPPEDSTGVAHILEHSVLCGSERFPVKDPFVELVKGSLNTFLNAMTYPDKTIYPVASCNDKDFANLMEVYMDAVFFPNIHHEKNIFLQEGWHYELESADADLSYNGVVYSEMKGVFSSPDEVLFAKIQQNLFPDTAYGVESGGDPDFIPELSYEQFLEFHKRYYHPVNSYIYLYGDMDVEERLLWMDKEYLSRFEKIELDSAIGIQENFGEKKKIEAFYSVNNEEEAKDAAYFAYGVTFGGEKDVVKETAVSLLCSALINKPGTPLKLALTEAGIGEDCSADFTDVVAQPFLAIIAKNATADKADDFLRVVTETLETCVKEGVSKKSLYAALNSMEFSLREGDSGNYPKGLRYCQMMFGTWLYDDTRVFDNLYWTPVFDKLRALIETDYFETLIREELLHNNHAVFVKLLPKVGLLAEKEAEMSKKLATYKASLSGEEVEALVAQTAALKQYQSEPSKPEDLAKIPQLTRDDIKKEADPFVNEVKEIAGVTTLHQELFTAGIAYVKVLFDMKKVPAGLLSYAGILTDLFGRMNTVKQSYLDLNNEISINTGGISVSTMISSKYDDLKEYRIFLVAEGKTLYGKIPELFSYMKELLTETLYQNPERIREILLERKSGLESRYTDMAQGAAVKRASSYFSEVGVAMELLDGIAYYEFISDLLANYEERKEELIQKLTETYECIFAKDVMMLSVTADAEGYEAVKEQCIPFLEAFVPEAKGSGMTLVPEKKNEGFITPGQVQYVCCAGNFRDAGLKYTGSYEVLRTAMSYGYLWNQVRVLGGAYGAALMALENGRMAFYSWRDPHLNRTMKVYEDAVDYIANFEADEAEMTKYVIGTMSNVDMPRNPRMEGERGLTAYLTGRTFESVQKHRDEILNITVEDMRALAKGVQAMLSQNCCCTVGSEKKVREDASHFMTVRDLLK